MAENKNSGMRAVLTMSMSCQPRMNVVPANPTAANVNPMSAHAGRARMTHGEPTKPIAHITARKLTA